MRRPAAARHRGAAPARAAHGPVAACSAVPRSPLRGCARETEKSGHRARSASDGPEGPRVGGHLELDQGLVRHAHGGRYETAASAGPWEDEIDEHLTRRL